MACYGENVHLCGALSFADVAARHEKLGSALCVLARNAGMQMKPLNGGRRPVRFLLLGLTQLEQTPLQARPPGRFADAYRINDIVMLCFGLVRQPCFEHSAGLNPSSEESVVSASELGASLLSTFFLPRN